MQRRQFLKGTLAGFASAPLISSIASAYQFLVNPFTLGLASGDATADSIILWTRLAPEPLNANGGVPPIEIPVRWELSLDAAMSHIVQQGEVIASPVLAHSVHIDAQSLAPNTQYWYRFTSGSHRSATGRTRTLPAIKSEVDSIRFVTTSCQNYTHGHFTAYAHMVEDQPDFVVHLGDYIYDTSFGETFRQHETDDPPTTLDAYRRRHALYKTDTFLRDAHAALPFYIVIDNHDATEDEDPTLFAQRAAAYQAWYEHMPVRGYQRVGDNQFELQRLIKLGDLMQINLLDTRQFRDKKDLCRENLDPGFGFGNYREQCDELFPEERTMLGLDQEKWLERNFADGRAAWNVLASSGPFLPFRLLKDKKEHRYIGAWDAYPANRRRLVEAMTRAQGHPLVLSGDVHSFWAIDGAQDTVIEDQIPIVEFVTSSLSANWPEPLSKPITDNLPHNPHVQLYDGKHRGYLLHEVNRAEWKTTMRALDDVKDDQSTVRDLASFVVENGISGLRKIGK
jgi:alkaline phosphatase D